MNFLKYHFSTKKVSFLIKTNTGLAKYVNATIGTNLLDLIHKEFSSSIQLMGLCGKSISCATCKVSIPQHQKFIQQASQDQQDLLVGDKAQTDQRLSCQIMITQQFEGRQIQLISI